MAQYAWGRGWRSAALATDSVIVYFKDVVQAFKARWQQLGGKVVAQESYQDPTFGGNNVQNAVTRLNNVKADVIVTSTAGAYGALGPFITGLRTLGNNTPILNSWAGDGTYWLPKSPKVSNYYFVTYASSFGNDPSARDQQARQAGQGGHGRFRHRAGRDRRCRHRDQARRRLDERAPRSRPRWRSSASCRPSPGWSASHRSCTRSSAGSTA